MSGLVESFTPEQMAAVLDADRKARTVDKDCGWRHPPSPCPNTRPRWREIATTGFDEFGQGYGLGPYGGPPTFVGLRVPFLPTDSAGVTGRYLFLLAVFSVGHGECFRLAGYRQMATIGIAQTTGTETNVTRRVIEQQITTPFFRFPDGDISWHIRLLGEQPTELMTGQRPGAADMNSFIQYGANTPALLYGPPAPDVPVGRIYPNIATYTPPNGGRPYGNPIPNKMGDFFDIRTQWMTHGAWGSLEMPIYGPETVAFFCSVRQTDPNTRPNIVVPDAPPDFYSNGLSPEEQFILNFTTTSDITTFGPQYWRVAGSLIFEEM
jgi:hypothetical protein